MIIDAVLKGITAEQSTEKAWSPLRMSNAGKCGRAIAYQLHGFEGTPLPARSIMVFRLGHTIESEVKALIEKYCDLPITYPKDTISFEIEGKTITGHVDGLIGTDTVLEVKSINGMRFKMLDREGIPEDYKAQATAYMKALKRSKTLFVFYCKDTSHLREMTFEYDDAYFQTINARFTRVLRSTKTNLPDREYGVLKSGQLCWQCSYCSFTKECWPNAELKFDKNNKPQYLVKETV